MQFLAYCPYASTGNAELPPKAGMAAFTTLQFFTFVWICSFLSKMFVFNQVSVNNDIDQLTEGEGKKSSDKMVSDGKKLSLDVSSTNLTIWSFL